jgi:hypothetical protein
MRTRLFCRAASFAIAAVCIAIALTACNSSNKAGLAAANDARLDTIGNAPIITSATYQHTQYNGKPQPVETKTARGDIPVVVTYFPSLDALERNEGGTTVTPSEVGAYYARVERPAAKDYRAGRDITIEYYIQKALILITAQEKQTARYDGSPKRVSVSSEPPVELSVVYYKSAVDSIAAKGGTVQPPTAVGVYSVTASFAGDEHYRPASKDVEFTITRE